MKSLYKRRMNEKPVTEPSPWKEFVPVKGQVLPVPRQWLSDEEARQAHDMVLPQNLSQLMVPFDFTKAWWKSWLPWGSSVGDQYLDHLCAYEAGEWIFKTTEPQEGIYIARDATHVPDSDLVKVWDYEAMLLQYSWSRKPDMDPGRNLSERYFRDGPYSYVGKAGDDGRSGFRFVEFMNIGRSWQKPFSYPYLRAFGFHEEVLRPVRIPERPMRIIGLDEPTARYGITWRGLRRERDREYRISGYEQIAYELKTGDVIALRRQFVRMGPYYGGPTFGAPDRCVRINKNITFREYPFRIALIAIRSVTGARDALFVHPYPMKKGE